jgi:exopolysaccharide biosynthesis protein
MFLKKSRSVGALLLFVLAAVLCLALSAPALALTTSYSQVYDLGPGVRYYDVAGENSLGVQRAHYITYEPGTAVQPIVAYGRGFYGRSTISYVADYLKTDLQAEVLAGINADFFNLDTGVPIGIVINDGKLISSAGGAYAVGFREDGTAIFGKPQLTMYIKGESSGVLVENYNKTRSSYTVNLYDHNWGSETRISGMGTNVLLEKIDDTDPYIGCSIRMRVVSTTEVSSSTPIAANQMVLTIAATGDVTKVGVFQPGEEVTLSISATDSVWKEAVYAVGGKTLLLNGETSVSDTPTKTAAARTAIGFKDDGTVIFFENDGKQSGKSVGLSPEVLAEEMKALGATNALNLDGGGSSAFAARVGGNSLAVLNSPSDGSLRKCANYIFLLNRASLNGAEYLHIKTENRYVLAGASVPVTVTALNSALDSVSLPDELSLSEITGLGTVTEDNKFVAGGSTGTAVLRARCGDLVADQYVYILSSVGTLQVTRDGKTVSGLTVTPGDVIDLAVSGVYKGEAVALDASNVSWSVTGDIGTIDNDGKFHAGGKGTSGTIVAQSGSARVTIVVTQLTNGEGINIVGVTLPTSLNSGETGNFSFRVSAGYGTSYPEKDQLTLCVDGKAIDFNYAWATGIVSAEISGLSDGTHRLTLIAQDEDGSLVRKSLTFRVGSSDGALGYTDVTSTNWAASYIEYLGARGLMQGETTKTGEQIFAPNRNLTRAEFAVIAARYLGLDTSQAVSLPYADRADIPLWSLGAIRAVYADGIMTGEDVKGETYFYPRNNITRQEAMAVISRILTDKYTAQAQSFTDGEQISAWALPHVERLVTLGFVGGYEDGTIRPLENITRAEIAKILFNLY